jgi:galactonate dehydratase
MAASQAAAIPTSLEIGSFEVFPVREPASRRPYTVVRVATKSGVAGFGECRSLAAAEVAKAQSALPGKSAAAYEVLRRELAGSPQLGAAVNMALLDILGKSANAPVYQVLGGPTRNKVRALATLAGDSEPAVIGSWKRASAAGFRAFAIPVSRPVHRTRSLLEALRTAAGDAADFVLDGGGTLSPGEAAALATSVERLHPLWFDEPCPTGNLKAARKISDETVVPLGVGRGLHESAAFQDLLREEAADVLRPDLAFCGISQIRRIAALAEAYYIAVAPHHDGGPVGTAAALHLAASLPNFFVQHIPQPDDDRDRKMRSELVREPVESVKDGFLKLPSAPGLGITVNVDALKRYREDA